MNNQHRKISGYRELSQAEIDLMNRIKEQGRSLEALLKDVQRNIVAKANAAVEAGDRNEIERLRDSEWARWAAMAKTDFQTALMKLTRAVAQPTFF